ncbi:MAG: hypothetical protein CMD83_06110 [Gammaproteobacteria bacterium]|nr:hypothetical protein [Gammaproteobacteria bacterium]
MSALPHVIDVTMQNFQTEVGEKSRTTPVLLEFYAEGAEQSAALTPVLVKLAEHYAGKFILGRVDIQENQQLVQQLQVRTLPTLKLVFQGQLAQSLEGPIEEATLRELLDQVTMSPMERIREEIDRLLGIGDREGAMAMLQQAIGEEPKNYGLHTELCDLLIMAGRADEAKQILEAIPADAEGIAKPRSRLEFIELAGELGAPGVLQAAVAEDSGNLQARFDLAIALIVNDQIEPALDQLLEIMSRDKEWSEEAARTTMIKVFDLLGKGNPVATAYRRRMFTLMH